MFEFNNDKIIIPDQKLQQSLQSWIIYVPELKNLCLEHIIIIDNEKIPHLINENINNEYYIEIPPEIIYSDPSSMFWLHPDLNYIINNYSELVYSWKDLCDVFVNFCTTNKKHCVRKDDNIFMINPNSELSKFFKFKYFHQDQIEEILKQVTKYLGKTNSLKFCCSNLTFKNLRNKNDAFKFIDLIINNYNKYIPSMSSFIYL